MKKKGNFLTLKLSMLFLGLGLFMIGCKQTEIVELTTTDVNITGYLDQNERFSDFRKIMEISGTAGFLKAYGSYTLFAPNNDAVKAYMQEKGVTSVEQLGTPEELKQLVYFHLIEDSVKTTRFSDGRLPNPTKQGQYLTTGAITAGEMSNITINKQANLVKANISTGNGIIHEIDHVLKPTSLTVAQVIDADPEYSIFAQALKETQFFERLNILPKQNPKFSERYLTVFAESNATLKAAGFNSYHELKARYSTKGNPADPQDSLNIYIAYHVLNSVYYYPDLITSPSATTLAEPTLSISSKGDDQVMLDELQIGETLEAGAPVERAKSDITASNGVVHSVGKHFRIIKRTAQPVYYDLADQPEFRRLPAWRTGTFTYSRTMTPKIARIIYGAGRGEITYIGNDPLCAGRDYLSMRIGGTNTVRAPYYDFITPYTSVGKYRLWICYKKSSNNCPTSQVYFNGKKLSRTFDTDLTSGGAVSMSEDQREVNGWKQYTNGSLNTYLGRSMGIVEVTKDGPQTIRVEPTNGGDYGNGMTLDMIHLIPDGMNQLWPRFDENGNKIPRGDNPVIN